MRPFARLSSDPLRERSGLRIGNGDISPVCDRPYDNAARRHCQKGRQMTLAVVISEELVIVMSNGGKGFHTKLIPLRRRQPDAAHAGRVIDHMEHEPQKPVDKILPSPGFVVEAPFQKTLIEIGKGHIIARG